MCFIDSNLNVLHLNHNKNFKHKKPQPQKHLTAKTAAAINQQFIKKEGLAQFEQNCVCLHNPLKFFIYITFPFF